MWIFWFSLHCQHNGILKEKYSSAMFEYLHDYKVTLTKNFALLLDTL